MPNKAKQEALKLIEDYSKEAGWASITGSSKNYTKETLAEQFSELINSQVLQAIEKAKAKATPEQVVEELGDGARIVREGFVPLSVVEDLIKEYKGDKG